MFLSICYPKVLYLQSESQLFQGSPYCKHWWPAKSTVCLYCWAYEISVGTSSVSFFPVLPTKHGTDTPHCHFFFCTNTSWFCFAGMTHTIITQDQSPEQMNSLCWAEYFIRLHSMLFSIGDLCHITVYESNLPDKKTWSIQVVYLNGCIESILWNPDILNLQRKQKLVPKFG